MTKEMWQNPDYVPNEHKLGGKVCKGESFMEGGMTLITETDADRYLDLAAKRNRNKRKEELYDLPSTT